MHIKPVNIIISISLSIMFLASAACSFFPGNLGTVAPVTPITPEPHTRLLETPDYVGNRSAIIFTVPLPANTDFNNTADRIIRLFAEHKAPLDIALPPADDYSNYIFLRPLVDAGLVDISINGKKIKWLESDILKTAPAYIMLKNTLQQSRDKIKFVFGDVPITCLLPSEYYDQVNYVLLQETGFRVLPLPYGSIETFSAKPLDWYGEIKPDGLFRLPVMGTADYTTAVDPRVPRSLRVDPDIDLMTNVEKGINDIGVAVVEIEPAAFTKEDNTPDSEKIQRLSNLLQLCMRIGDISTFEGWYAYTSRWATTRTNIKRVLPAYNGGPAIIFRMDDIAAGYHEDVVEAIIKLFEENGVPVDLGIVASVDDTESYSIPWLKNYLERGIIGISVHGYDWTYYQFDTTREKVSKQIMQGDICAIQGAAEEPPPPEEKLTYAYIKLKLMQARDSFLQYFGVVPVALTVPTDYYDETGYRAINDAGFDVFATQVVNEPHPSTVRVDYFGRKTPTGMYRIPTATDVCVWEDCAWGDVYDISRIVEINGYCQYHAAWTELTEYNDFGAMLCTTLGSLGVAAIGIHPDAFVGIDGKPNMAKLEKVDKIIKWCKTIATITTFEQWYNYTSSINK